MWPASDRTDGVVDVDADTAKVANAPVQTFVHVVCCEPEGCTEICVVLDYDPVRPIASCSQNAQKSIPAITALMDPGATPPNVRRFFFCKTDFMTNWQTPRFVQMQKA